MLSSDYSSQPSVSVSQLPPQDGLVGGGSSGAGGGTAHPTWGRIDIFIMPSLKLAMDTNCRLSFSIDRYSENKGLKAFH